jgi:antitoxin component YwqK of YwqJK toxin-antitoxin module
MGKEYDWWTDNLIFEGKFLNGLRNGKGKEYENGKLIYEGEYLNGKRKSDN